MERGHNKRKNVRFKPDFGKFCYIDLDENRGEFIPTVFAFIVNESMGGCNLVIHETDVLQVGDKCRLKLGTLHPLKAVVCRHKVIESKVVSVGMRLLE